MRLGIIVENLVVRLTLGLGVVALFNGRLAEWVALALMVFAGIPHGAFDLEVARRVWGESRRRSVVVCLYVLVGVAMSAVCLLFPTFGLMIFLAVSVLHFSEGERPSLGHLQGWIVAFAAVVVPIAFHLETAIEYLRFFVEPGAIERYAGGFVALGVILAIGVLGVVLAQIRGGLRGEGYELLLCLAAWCLYSPLAGFTVWFIGRHSRLHLARCRAIFARGPRLFTPDAIAISIGAMCLLVPLGLLFDLTDLEQLFSASIVLIAGLTLPHMVVTHRLEVSSRGGI